MIPKYNKLNRAQYELIEYLKSVGKYHPTRSLIERVIHDIDKVVDSNPIKLACTPEPGYVDQVLKETGRY